MLTVPVEPVITCDDNVTARVGDMHIDITCHVDHTSVNVDYYSWEIGDSGEVITLGEMTSDNDDMSVTVRILCVCLYICCSVRLSVAYVCHRLCQVLFFRHMLVINNYVATRDDCHNANTSYTDNGKG